MAFIWFLVLLLYNNCTDRVVDPLFWLLLVPMAFQDGYDIIHKK